MIVEKVLGTFDSKKDGTRFVSKSGKPYKKQSIVFKEYGDRIFSIPVFDDKEYKVGDDIKGEATNLREFNGKLYGDWQFPLSEKKKLEKKNQAMADALKAAGIDPDSIK